MCNYVCSFKEDHLWIPGYKSMFSSEIGIISLISPISKHKYSETELPKIIQWVIDRTSNITPEPILPGSCF